MVRRVVQKFFFEYCRLQTNEHNQTFIIFCMIYYVKTLQMYSMSMVNMKYIQQINLALPICVTTSLPTASITPLKQLCCISMTISSMPSDHRSCHVFASLIWLPQAKRPNATEAARDGVRGNATRRPMI